ncbi:hypothetical protein N431DRAFT_434269 [Stipitochalara longipes BDJ]|nr:hypothetical protein N431DRAFT_434269 [Stipitochalara longipes BDJ]
MNLSYSFPANLSARSTPCPTSIPTTAFSSPPSARQPKNGRRSLLPSCTGFYRPPSARDAPRQAILE